MPDIEELLRQMTVQEKVAMLAGTDDWYTVPVERLGIPSLKMSDGPNGARGAGGFTAGVKAACFPAGISLASTWNSDLVARVGQALAREAKMKGAQVLLGPTVNIQRSPLGGRNFECFSEDPYLSARLAVAYITGLQEEGVGASVKHYVCNDEEFERFSISSEIRERVMREIYLLPFQVAVREVKPWTIMAAYNLVNGIAASEHAYLLTDILRDEWGFDGVVMSDWFFSVKSTAASVNAGLDLEMPSAQWRGQKLLDAVERGEVTEATVNTSVRRLLQLSDSGSGRGGYRPAQERAAGPAAPTHTALLDSGHWPQCAGGADYGRGQCSGEHALCDYALRGHRVEGWRSCQRALRTGLYQLQVVALAGKRTNSGWH